MKKSSIKLIVLITVLILVFVIFLLFINKAHSYEMEYTVNNVKVIEKYNYDKSYYEFNIKYEDIDTTLISLNKYTKSRYLIKDIVIDKNDDDICLDFSNSLVELYPICHNNDGYYTKYIKEQATFTKNDSYENILIDNLNNKSYLLWNYNGLIYINNGNRNTLKLFNKDTYNISLYYQYDNYLVIPNYNQEWIFDEIIVINATNGKNNNIKLRFPVYFDSYFLGNIDNYVYLYDRKEEQEYYIDIKKEDIIKATNKVYVDGKWENVSSQKLKNKEVSFVNNQPFNYYLKGNTLYATGDIKISNRSIDTIVRIDNLDVYYLVDGILYTFNPMYGEKALLKYSEWEFNSNNMIFIF